MTREEFETKRTENINRFHEMQTDSRNRAEELEGKPGKIAAVMRFLNSVLGRMAKSAENQIKNAKYKQ